MVDLQAPTKNIQLLLYALSKLQPANGRIKLYKIHYLIEKEGHVKYDMPINCYPLGPVDYVSINFCTENKMIHEVSEAHFGYSMYSIYLTDYGKKYFENQCLPLITPVEIIKADKIIEKYKNKSGTEILNYVHQRYVDDFIDTGKIKQVIESYQKNIPIFTNLIQKNLEKPCSIELKDKIYTVLGYLEHLNQILEKLKFVRDPVHRGQVLSTIKDIMASLNENDYLPNNYTMELLDYLDSYCEKESICPSISDENLNDIPQEERERLTKTITEMQIPPFS